MNGFVLRFDSTTEDHLYNFRYYTDSEGSSSNPIKLDNFDAVINLLLTEIRERDVILNKLKVTREVSINSIYKNMLVTSKCRDHSKLDLIVSKNNNINTEPTLL